MFSDFIKDTQRFCVIKNSEKNSQSEGLEIKFQNRHEIQNFFENTMKDTANRYLIPKIAQYFYPSFCCRSSKPRPQPSIQQCLENLFANIEAGNLSVIFKKNNLFLEQNKLNQFEDRMKDLVNDSYVDFKKFAEGCSKKIVELFSKLYHADYYIFEKVFHCDENTIGPIPAIIDVSSIKDHSTGWRTWDDPFELSVLGAFKAAASFRLSTFLGVGKKIQAAMLLGAQTELISEEYLVTGKSVIQKKWYGSYAIRFNLRTLTTEVPWVKFKACGPEERVLIELKRKDRFVFAKKPVYYHQEVLIPPFILMEEFLSDYEKGFVPPEYDIEKPIMIG